MTSDPHILNDRFRKVLRLGGGGQASVWLGEDTWLGRRVALKQVALNKLVPRGGSEDIFAMRTRAIQEARAMARVRHPALVTIHDILFIDGDTSTGDPWLVMEFIDGKTLQELIDSQLPSSRLDDATIAAIGLAVLDGLCAVHRAQIVHRDVKPDNILIAGDLASGAYSVFLVDFGIAKMSGVRQVTLQNNIIGTPAYIAPERLRNGPVGPAADVWSLGVTLYCAVDGASPFRRDGEYANAATTQAILEEEPLPPRRESALAGIIFRMLVKDPAQRAEADEVRAALTACVRHARQPACEPGEQSSRVGRVVAREERAELPHQARMRVVDVRDLILTVGTDTGIAMLMSIPGQDAAAILASCPDRNGANLLTGVASAQPHVASAIMGMLNTGDAIRLIGHLGSRTAAEILTGMPPWHVARILDAASDQIAARAVKNMPVQFLILVFRAMNSYRAAAVLSDLKPATAAAVLRGDPVLWAPVWQLIPQPERAQIARYLTV